MNVKIISVEGDELDNYGNHSAWVTVEPVPGTPEDRIRGLLKTKNAVAVGETHDLQWETVTSQKGKQYTKLKRTPKEQFAAPAGNGSGRATGGPRATNGGGRGYDMEVMSWGALEMLEGYVRTMAADTIRALKAEIIRETGQAPSPEALSRDAVTLICNLNNLATKGYRIAVGGSASDAPPATEEGTIPF
jgi:hypothetical protein